MKSSERGYVQLKVYDLLGSEIATLVDEERSEGIYHELFFADELPSGVYVYSLEVYNLQRGRIISLEKIKR